MAYSRTVIRETVSPVMFFPLHKRIAGNLAGGIVLSWFLHHSPPSGRIFVKRKELRNSVSFTKKEMRKAMRAIRKLQFIHNPSKNHYEIDWPSFHKYLEEIS